MLRADEITKSWVEGEISRITTYGMQCRRVESASKCGVEVMAQFHSLCGEISGEISAICARLNENRASVCQWELQRTLTANSDARVAAANMQKTIYGNAESGRQRVYDADLALLEGYARSLAAMLPK